MDTMLTTQSAQEFTDARRQAFIEEWLDFFKGRPSDLLSFEEVKQRLRLQDSAYKGIQEIELDKIVGSTGRYRDFTRTFLPKSDQTEQRWRRIDVVAHTQGFPPIQVFQVGTAYFVRDGNHRVSVARKHNVKIIEAEVIEYKTSVPIDRYDNLDKILIKQEQTDFFAQTHLDKIRPDQTLHLTEPGHYLLVLEHIAFHKYLKERENGRELNYQEAVESWYDQVYLPTLHLIHKSKILKHFPDRTETDLYVWLLQHRAQFEQEFEALGQVPVEDVIEDLKLEKSSSTFAHLVNSIRRKFHLQQMPLKVERTKFLTTTNLDNLYPQHEIYFSEPCCYPITQEHIKVHKYLKETELGQELSFSEAVQSWYETVYQPIIKLIQSRQLLKHFPDNTPADLYLWFVSRRANIEAEQQNLGQVPVELILDDLEKSIPSGPLTRLRAYLRYKFNL